MKAITTLFESILSTDESIVWRPTDGPTEYSRGWKWDPAAPAARGWKWDPIDAA
ncbi:hypothetical protein [Knoellia koreensis]|uniref:Uncharacterized protein n=1 Tax=Knoellia koreensis TaxID=2730921 RepID=A0A849H7S8_9MICO|nr:hypothetical protein [Knoellia sp. DB2414S]NNM45796.1 hypothetical protein [Knoellia sp. DB2414S]